MEPKGGERKEREGGGDTERVGKVGDVEGGMRVLRKGNV